MIGMRGIGETMARWPPAMQCGVLIVFSGILVTVQLAIVRYLAHEVNVFEIVFFRGVFGVLAICPMMLGANRAWLRPNRPWLLALTGTLAFLATVGFYFAAKHLPIADITAIHFSRPLFAAIVAAIVLGETLRGGRIVAIVAGLVGAAIIIRPGMVELNVGVLYVLGVVAVQSWNPINRKLLSRSEHPDTIAIWVTIVILPWSMIVTPFVWTTPSLELVAWMAAVGTLEVLNQRVLSRAYIHGDAVVVVALHYTRLPIAALVGIVVFAEFPEIWTWIGGAVIAGAALYLAHRESVAARGRKAEGGQAS
jgi:drug/metabolite transporter (DMT)-like permease